MLTVRVGALEIAYRELGSGDPVLLINGTGESGATWALQVEALAPRWRCVAIDQRDTGRSTYVRDPYTPRDLAADAAGAIEGVGLGPCHVVGFSLGGAAAQELAIARPELVRSLSLIATWARSDTWLVAQMRNWQAVRRAHADDEGAFLDALEAWLLSPVTLADAGLRARVRALWDADEPSQRADGWMRQCEADIAHDATDRLGSVRAPALVLVGEDDLCTPPRYSRALASLLPGAELVVVPDAGHCVAFERPEAVNEALARFLGRAGSRG